MKDSGDEEEIRAQHRPATGGETVARLHHDVRQSLATMQALMFLLRSDEEVGSDTAARLDLVQHELDWVAELLATVDGATALQPVDVGDAVSDAWKAVAASAPCKVRLLREPGLVAWTEIVALRRAARNLLDNAVRAAGPHGKVEARVFASSDRVVLEVTDDGPGFGRVIRHQGLGLATVRGFLARSRGRLDVGRSHLGGARLTLSLPRQVEAWPAERTSA